MKDLRFPMTALAAHRSAAARVLAFALSLLALFGVTMTTSVSPAKAYAHDSRERTMVGLTNAARSQHHRQPLAMRSDLQTIAQRWATRMAASGTLAHNPQLGRQVRHYKVAGENVGYGPGIRQVHTALMHSPGHRANILNKGYTQVGMAVVHEDNRVWVVQVFRKPA
jgi:uncharacterized protein YkwD